MPQINPRTFADAKQLGDGIYELILTNWGNRGQAQDANNGSIIFPPVASNPNTGFIPAVPFPNGIPDSLVRGAPLPSLFAISISPRSHVDRCILQFSVPQLTTQTTIIENKTTTVPDPNVIKNGGILETEQELSVGTQLIGQLNGPIVVRADSAHWFDDTYSTIGGGGGSATFGTALGIPDTNIGGLLPAWINPELRLLLYLTSRGTLPPTTRAPLRAMFLWGQDFVGVGPEVLLRVIPIMGRRHVTVSLYLNNASGQGTFRIAGVMGSGGPGSFENAEIDLGISAVTLGAGDSKLINFTNSAPAISFLLFYGKHSGGNAVDAVVTVEATDF